MKSSKLVLYLHTIRYLTFRQFAYNVIRRFKKASIITSCSVHTARELPVMPVLNYAGKLVSRNLRFLNVALPVDAINDWSCTQQSKLWRYNLHYFDYLLDAEASDAVKDELIEGWLKAAPKLQQDAWEPYPVSLRIVNWVKYFLLNKHNTVADVWLQSLAGQAETLFHSIEYHILANHYLKNGKALLFAGAYINNDKSDAWFEKGLEIVLSELNEQIHSDGGHYENSPMYHSIVVEDYLDAYNLLSSYDAEKYQIQLGAIKNTLVKMLQYIEVMRHPDGDIALFNDAAFGIAPHPDEILDYAARLIDYKSDADLVGQTCVLLGASGYSIIQFDNHKMIIDCGNVSPTYQPGHTHCDLLSYELSVDAERVVVDTGVYDYIESAQRAYCRSTRAHNTVSIDKQEQSEVWGSFRVARRASNVQLNHFSDVNDGAEFSGQYSPFWNKNLTHKRDIQYRNNSWSVVDEIYGDGKHPVESFIHLHPDIRCLHEQSVIKLFRGDREVAVIEINCDANIALEESEYYPEFGKIQSNTVIALSKHDVLPIEISYVIRAGSAI